MITAQEKKKRLASGDERQYTYYHCTRKRPCSQSVNIREEVLFEQIDKLLVQYELSPMLYEWGMEAIADIAKEQTKRMMAVDKMQHDSIESVKTEMNNLIMLASKGSISVEEFEENRKPLKQRLETLQKEQRTQSKAGNAWYDTDW